MQHIRVLIRALMFGGIALSFLSAPVLAMQASAYRACLCAQVCGSMPSDLGLQAPNGQRLSCPRINEEVLYDSRAQCKCDDRASWFKPRRTPWGQPITQGRPSPNH